MNPAPVDPLIQVLSSLVKEGVFAALAMYLLLYLLRERTEDRKKWVEEREEWSMLTRKFTAVTEESLQVSKEMKEELTELNGRVGHIESQLDHRPPV